MEQVSPLRFIVGALLHQVQTVGRIGRGANASVYRSPRRITLMTKNNCAGKSPAVSNIDWVVHAIVLAMARRQMQIAWPRR
jgi:hypothetical protein